MKGKKPQISSIDKVAEREWGNRGKNLWRKTENRIIQSEKPKNIAQNIKNEQSTRDLYDCTKRFNICFIRVLEEVKEEQGC